MQTKQQDAEPVAAVSHEASQHLYQAGVGSLIAALIYCYWTTGGDISLAQILSLGVIIFCSLPALLWAKNNRTWFPAFEISMLACVAFYAMPMFKGRNELADFSEASQNQAALVVLVYALAANFGYAQVRYVSPPPTWATTSLLPAGSLRWLPAGMVLNVAYAYLSIYTDLLPPSIDGTLRALSFGVGIMSTFILARSWGLGQLSSGQVAFYIFNVTTYLLIGFSSLYLIGGISLLALAFISYASARRKIPWLTLLLAGTIITLLHPGKSEMRKLHWDPDTKESIGAPVSSLTKLPDFYHEWIIHSLAAIEAGKKDPGLESASIFDRASLIQMICLCVEDVPGRKPFLWGESYIDIPAQIIPRFLWPGKPSSLLANIRLAVYFNLVAEDSGFSVSIAFGPLAEAYVNFGYFGVVLLGLLIGAIFKHISMSSDGMPQFSALGIFMILLTAWSFQAEQVMATWLSSLFQACVICIGLPVAYKKITAG